MARVWTEPFHPEKHSAALECRGSIDDHLRAPGLIPKNVLLVNVASFTFQFFTAQQLRDCLAYFNLKTHPSSRLPIGSADHWEVQRWFERLPMYLLEEPKRKKVIRALDQALKLAEKEGFSGPSEKQIKRNTGGAAKATSKIAVAKYPFTIPAELQMWLSERGKRDR